MNRIGLSYLICTYNRVSFLKILLPNVIDNLLPDEEIIVVDGNSTDGAKEYLQQLYAEGKIHQFVSEPDRNQAHGWNKALLMARGTVIKKLIDDDVHNFKAIRKCCDLMLANKVIDICISNHLESDLTNPDKIDITGRLPEYTQWKKGLIKSFTFSDVSMLVRRSSLSFLGLYDTQFKMMDWEYSLRLSYLQAKIAYYTGYNSLAVNTPGNVTSTATGALRALEGNIGKLKYNYAGDNADITPYSNIKIWVGTLWQRLTSPKKSTGLNIMPTDTDLKNNYSFFYQKIDEYNNAGSFEFIY